MSFDKLVRDNIPNIIEQSGRIAKFRVMNDEEYKTELIKKLQEEVDEFKESENIEELADILEVIYALAKAKGSSVKEVENIRIHKAEERGSFDKKIFLMKNN